MTSTNESLDFATARTYACPALSYLLVANFEQEFKAGVRCPDANVLRCYCQHEASTLKSRPTHLYFGASGSPEIKTAIYRWEFLRRNPDYHADYNRFIGSFGDWLKDKSNWDDSETRTNWTKWDQNYFHTEIEPGLTELYQKWKPCDLLPPELGREEWTQGYESRQDGRDFPPTCISADDKWDSRSIRELKRMGFEGTGTSARKYQNLLLIQVDLNSPMKDILDYVHRALRSAKGINCRW